MGAPRGESMPALIYSFPRCWLWEMGNSLAKPCQTRESQCFPTPLLRPAHTCLGRVLVSVSGGARPDPPLPHPPPQHLLPSAPCPLTPRPGCPPAGRRCRDCQHLLRHAAHVGGRPGRVALGLLHRCAGGHCVCVAGQGRQRLAQEAAWREAPSGPAVTSVLAGACAPQPFRRRRQR